MTDVFEEFKAGMVAVGITQEDTEMAAQDILGELGNLVEQKQAIEAEIVALQEQLKAKEDELKNYDQIKIPNLIEAAGLQEITTRNGYKVSIKQEYRGNISEANSQIALDWFIKSGGADTVKNEYRVPISIADKTTMELLEGILKRSGLSFARKLNIPWNTLSAVIRDLDGTNQLENNQYFEQLKESDHTIPKDLTLDQVLGVYKYKTTKVTKPKVKKK